MSEEAAMRPVIQGLYSIALPEIIGPYGVFLPQAEQMHFANNFPVQPPYELTAEQKETDWRIRRDVKCKMLEILRTVPTESRRTKRDDSLNGKMHVRAT